MAMTTTVLNFCPTATINHAALRHNLGVVKKIVPHSRIWAVIKADAYGHGATEIANSLEVDGLAVARLGEAKKLRRTEKRQPILIMGGVHSVADLMEAVALHCELVIHNPAQAEMLLQVKLPKPIKIWLKVNTGMNRLGLTLEQAAQWLIELTSCSNVQDQPGLMTHLANADELNNNLTNLQCQRLSSITNALNCDVTIGNSAGILGWKAARSEWVRPGIMLYGISPFSNTVGKQYDLQPVMTLRAPLIAIHHCQPGDAIGYGGSYLCPQAMQVGVIGIGYGDGYPRHAPVGTPVLINGNRATLIGRVSMDMLTVDLRNIPEVRIGDRATLWGENLPAEEIAACANTIAYQLVTGITERVPRLHINQTEVSIQTCTLL